MASTFLLSIATAIFVISFTVIVRHLSATLIPRASRLSALTKASRDFPEPTALVKRLKSALPDNVVLPQDVTAFDESQNAYWAQQETEAVPGCFVRPSDVRQLSTAVIIIKAEYDQRQNQGGEARNEGLFAVRGGGHSPVAGAASINGGVLIDLSLFREVTPSEDGTSVVIGAGAKWMDVSKVLDERGLVVVGGRNSAVGVGGLTLGGGLSFFTPRFGFVCSNIISYEIVLASGTITTASSTTNPDLWRALKGGSNNFGIVTLFTARSFPSTPKIWAGFLYMPSFEGPRLLSTFHSFVSNANPHSPTTKFDDHAAGPILGFSYVQQLGLQVLSASLAYTSPTAGSDKKWPECWENAGFRKLWRTWSSTKIRTLTDATDEMNNLNPSGRRQAFVTTTIKNDKETIAAAHAAYTSSIAQLRPLKLKDLVWTLNLQPLLPEWVRKGDPNPMGFDAGFDEPLVIVSFTVNWGESKDDEVVKTTMRGTIEQIEKVAGDRGTGHRYRYLNYCAGWQKPFQGYGEENWRFLRETSRKYDPQGLFQKGCVGGFKLDV